MKPLPGSQAPALSAQITTGETWTLAEQEPKSMTLVVAYRGHH